MKNIHILFFIFLCSIPSLFAQENEKVVVPLSDPGKPGFLEVGLVNGSIKVSGHSGKEVVVNAKLDEEDHDDDHHSKKEAQGMKKISNRSISLTIEEDDNKVKIHNEAVGNGVRLEIMVPFNFGLTISTVNDGDLKVENVSGEIEANNVNGDIVLKDISGSAVVNTVNGKIEVFFKEINQGKSMAFTTLNGDVDVSIPANAKATVKMKSEMGEMFTDFDIQTNNNTPKVETTQDGKGKRYKLEKWISGNINGGGPEFVFKTMHGDIYIRKRK